MYPVTTDCTVTYPANFNMPVEKGEIYATDPTSNTLTIKFPLTYTTTSFKIAIFNLATIAINTSGPSPTTPVPRVTLTLSFPKQKLTQKQLIATFPRALTKINPKDLKKREDHQLKLATEHLFHQNTNASPSAVSCYDALLKACSQVEWTNITRTGKRQELKTNILVMKEMGGILVVEPYDTRACVLSTNLKKGVGQTGAEKVLKKESLERVRKIIEARGQTQGQAA
ncbi:hypothetical protein TL16_g05059 [Triparma laevis f. inornata]|uniref:AD domain-containing protein n=1 Tax=Triparma laevis f. inornata TaxID=1714386 RepID=A0A9W7E876_9STRA|nr:hypothetical protein TL16_g05059 [Triparma laevis f. inornata]